MHDPAMVEQQNGACIALEGRTFASVNELECGRALGGAGRCQWQITFAVRDGSASEFVWQHRSGAGSPDSPLTYSDVAESGRVECRGETLRGIASRKVSVALGGTFDPATQVLTWAGQTYLAQ